MLSRTYTPKGKSMGKKVVLKLVSVHLPEKYVELLEKLVENGLYPSRSEAIRVAVRDLIRKELWREETYSEKKLYA